RIEVARSQPAAAKPVQTTAATPKLVPAKARTKPQAKLAGAPIQVVDASGSPDAAKRLSLRLARLGWSVQTTPAPGARPVEATRIDYPARTPQIAQAL